MRVFFFFFFLNRNNICNLFKAWATGTCLSTVKRRELAGFGHVTRHDGLSNNTLHCTLEGGRRRGRQRKCWMNDVKEWTSVLTPELFLVALRGKDWKRISAESSLRSRRQPIRTELNSTSFLCVYYIALAKCIVHVPSRRCAKMSTR